MKSIITTASTCSYETELPKAWVSINKNRQKTYDLNTVYLKNNTEFEIELFNPSTKKVLASITINGVKMGNKGLILKPGQRFHLDRFLTDNKKLLFETYEVENSTETEKAIRNNGILKIEFFHEEEPLTFYKVISTNQFTNVNDYLYRNDNSISKKPYDSNITCTYCSCNSLNSEGTIETGRIEKGNESKQVFNEQSFQSQTFPCNVVEYILLPISQKVICSSDINEEKKYCTNCGKKVIKKSFKFCPSCGSKI